MNYAVMYAEYVMISRSNLVLDLCHLHFVKINNMTGQSEADLLIMRDERHFCAEIDIHNQFNKFEGDSQLHIIDQ